MNARETGICERPGCDVPVLGRLRYCSRRCLDAHTLELLKAGKVCTDCGDDLVEGLCPTCDDPPAWWIDESRLRG